VRVQGDDGMYHQRLFQCHGYNVVWLAGTRVPFALDGAVAWFMKTTNLISNRVPTDLMITGGGTPGVDHCDVRPDRYLSH
jgi:hypothetical protein